MAAKFLSYISQKDYVIAQSQDSGKAPQRIDVTAADLGWEGSEVHEKMLDYCKNVVIWNDNAMQSDVAGEISRRCVPKGHVSFCLKRVNCFEMRRDMIKIERKEKKLFDSENRQGWLAVIIPLFLIFSLCAYPFIVGLYESFTNWDGLFKNDFVGLKNYIKILTDSRFWMLLSNNCILLLYLPVQVILGLIVAVFVYDEIPGWKFYRACYYIPQVTSALSIGYIFAVLFGLDGPINTLIGKIGIDAIHWLGSRGTGLFVIIICMVWSNIGWQAFLFLGGMTQISPSIYEAALLDGAGYWTRMFKITLPMLIHTLVYSCIMSIIWCFTGLFSLVTSITGGGPGYDTTTVDYMIYLKAFNGGSQFGYACALSIILMLIVLVLSVLNMRASDKLDDWSH